MDNKKRYREFIVPVLVVILALGNYSRLTGIENIRAIHIVTLITIGMALGVLLRNIFTFYRRRGGDRDTEV